MQFYLKQNINHNNYKIYFNCRIIGNQELSHDKVRTFKLKLKLIEIKLSTASSDKIKDFHYSLLLNAESNTDKHIKSL